MDEGGLMAQWARANVGAFAAAARLRWDRLRDEFAAWRASVNNIENAQLAGGVTFPLGYLAADRCVSRMRFWLDEAPRVATLGGTFQPDNIVRPVGAHRFAFDVVVREGTLSIATGGSPILIQRQVVQGVGVTEAVDPATLDHVTFYVVRLDPMHVQAVVNDGGWRTAGMLYKEPFAELVAGPVNVSNIISLLLDDVAIPPQTVQVLERVGDAQVDIPCLVPFNVTTFQAGDVLVGVIETPRMKNPGGSDLHNIFGHASRMSFVAQYEQEHRP